MGHCQVCGAETTPAFECSRCGHEFCGDHHLPENHRCTGGGESTAELTGDGPNTDDLKTTGRHGGGAAGAATCRACGGAVDAGGRCDACGGRYCADCVPPSEHGCPGEG